MTDKELRKLKRADLLEILFYLRKEADALREENDSLRQQLENFQSGFSDSDLVKITDAVKTAAEEYFRVHSEKNMANENTAENSDAGK